MNRASVFRPKRSAHGAAKQVQRTIRRGHRYAADIDRSKFFDRLQHDVLMSRVARRVRDPMLLSLIGRYLRAGVMVDGVLQPTDVGTSQGARLLGGVGPDGATRPATRLRIFCCRAAEILTTMPFMLNRTHQKSTIKLYRASWETRLVVKIA